MSHVEIKLGASGRGTVVVDGRDISNDVVSLTLQAEAGEHPMVLLGLRAESVTVIADAEVDTEEAS